MSRREHVDVVVVGAGIAGLAAARDLIAAGLVASVHEARDRVGGRLFSIPTGRGAVDLGASWFWPGETQVQALVAELQVGVFEQSVGGDALFEASPRGVERLAGNPIDVPSGRFVGGAQTLARRMAEDLAPGVLHLGDAVTAVHVDKEHAFVHASRGVVRAAHVILALPPALMVSGMQITPRLPDQVATLAMNSAVWMGDVVKAVAVYKQPFWRDAGLAGATVSHVGPYRELHDHCGPDADPAALFGFARADQRTSTDPAAALRQQLVRLFGEQAPEPLQVHAVDWSRERWTSPASPSPRASTDSYGHPVLREPVHGLLHLASTETAASYAGHIEGALRAGRAAAEAVLRR